MSPQKLSPGSVLSDLFSMYFSNFLAFLLVMAVAFAPFLILSLLLMPTVDSTEGVNLAAGLSLILGVLLSTGAITHRVFHQLRGREISIGACLRVGLFSISRVLGVGALVILLVYGVMAAPAVALTGVLAAFPGADSGSRPRWALALIPVMPLCYGLAIFLYLKYFVAVPVAVEERTGTFSALRRSAFLTQGQRWPLFVFLFLLNMLSVVVFGLLLFFLPLPLPVLAPFLGVGVFFLMTSLFSTACAVVYYRLRSLKESIDSDDISSVFA